MKIFIIYAAILLSAMPVLAGKSSEALADGSVGKPPSIKKPISAKMTTGGYCDHATGECEAGFTDSAGKHHEISKKMPDCKTKTLSGNKDCAFEVNTENGHIIERLHAIGICGDNGVCKQAKYQTASGMNKKAVPIKIDECGNIEASGQVCGFDFDANTGDFLLPRARSTLDTVTGGIKRKSSRGKKRSA